MPRILERTRYSVTLLVYFLSCYSV